ncbi:MAG: ATP-binding cassette domain-containing protein, partial [Desulfobacteraceae bacterium]|nr:ATP-binding cassette domain-containing protein [Desulfobacteraceae bacterium]
MLELEAINAYYGSFQALFDIGLSVQEGEAVAVIGPNGAGKTTLLRVISGLVKAGGGELSMEGRNLKTVPPHSIIELGIAHVPENRRLFPRMSIQDNLKIGAFAPYARKQFRERLQFVYGLFPILAARSRQFAGTLSGG